MAYKELEKLAITDKLTKLYNRHKIDEVLLAEKNRAVRYGSSFGVLMLDVDHFKRINDTYGHHIGDQVLQNLAEILQNNSRNTDTIGRWGGEEFLVVLPEITKEALIHYAEILRAKVEEQTMDEEHKVTVSIGVSIYKPEESIETTVSRADDALYSAKTTGRNRVVFKA